MRPVRATALAAVLCALWATPAAADLTAFVGANTTPANRQVRGAAVGFGLLVVAFEFEYADTADDPTLNAPSLKTGMANLLLQTPLAFMGLQPYFTTGAGIYREELPPHRDTSVGYNTGGGAKIGFVGPLRLRVDYRVFKLRSAAKYSPVHRVYAGLNLNF